jgi:hypothetical protein
MTRWQRSFASALSVAAAFATVCRFVPENWIEVRFGIAPDGGSGSLEFLLIAVPAVMALATAILVFRLRLNQASGIHQ